MPAQQTRGGKMQQKSTSRHFFRGIPAELFHAVFSQKSPSYCFSRNVSFLQQVIFLDFFANLP
jgi:hypothetical protein